MPYRLLLPENYDASKQYPLVVFYMAGESVVPTTRSNWYMVPVCFFVTALEKIIPPSSFFLNVQTKVIGAMFRPLPPVSAIVKEHFSLCPMGRLLSP